jgi:hypothetical protein
MTFDEAKNLITGVLENQRMTIKEHTKIQQAWASVLSLAEQTQAAKDGAKNGDDDVPILDPVQPGQ